MHKQVTENIRQVGGAGLSSDEDAAVYLIQSKDEAAIIDSGCGRRVDKIRNNILSWGVSEDQVAYLLLTHCHFDHTGGANALKRIFNCKIVAHELDAAPLEAGDSVMTAANWYGAIMEPVKVDHKIKGKTESIKLGNMEIKAIHMPGHSPGSVVYMVNSSGKTVLFAQDVHGPLDAAFQSNAKDYQNSLKRMMALDADILCEGHFGIYKGKENVRQFIESFIC